MKNILIPSVLTLLLSAACGFSWSANPSQDITDTDPARWYVPDATPQMHAQTLKKEAMAAYQQAQGECRALRGAEKTACLSEAKRNFQADMAAAKQVQSR